MSVEAMALVLHHSKANGTAKVVLLGIANHDGDGGAWPSIATLCKYAQRSESAVQRAITGLVEAGEVRVFRNAGGTADTPNDRRPNRYELLLACPQECDGTTQHRQRGRVRATPRGRADAENGVASARPEPSLEPSLEPKSASSTEEPDARAREVTPEGPSSEAWKVANAARAREGLIVHRVDRLAKEVQKLLDQPTVTADDLLAAVETMGAGMTVTLGSLGVALTQMRQARTREREREDAGRSYFDRISDPL